MILAHRARSRATTVVVVLALAGIASAIFGAAMTTSRPWYEGAWIGVGSGALIGGPLLAWVLLGLETSLGRRLKRLPLVGYLGANIAVMSAALIGGHLAAFHLLWRSPGRFLDHPVLPPSLMFSVTGVMTIAIAIELRRLIGPGVFGALLAGRYRYPRAERRVFLLLDIVGSTAIAERLGPERFLAFLDRWIHALTEPLLASGGRIYRYVGDEVILTWTWTPGAPERALAFTLAAADAIAADVEAWRRDFGAAPRTRAALHAGPVVAGEIGDIKREIAFLGDTLNTAARIAEEARRHDALVLASAEALAGATLPEGLERADLGPVALRGKAEPVALALLRPRP
jgi:adenylate cyclase